MAQLSEHQIQSAWFDWAKLHPVARRAYAVPNAAKRGPRLAAMMLSEGLRKGVLDVHLPIAKCGSHGLFIEFKSGSNKLTPEQDDEREQLLLDGFTVIVSWDAVMAIDATQSYLNNTLAEKMLWLKPNAKAVSRM